jgi:hypothetical protein
MNEDLKKILSLYNQILENKKVVVGEADISGIDELVYNPATKNGGTIGHGYDNGNKVQGISWANHENHLHIGFTSRDVAMKVIDKAHQMGLNTTENPYAKKDPNGKVDTVHSKNSFHYKVFEGEPKVGAAVDISGNPERVTELIKWIESQFANGYSSKVDKTIDIPSPSSGGGSLPVDTELVGAMTHLGKAMGLRESFGKNIKEKYGTILIPSNSNSKILCPIDGVVVNSKYSQKCSNGLTIKIDGGLGYLQFCGISNVLVRKGDFVSVGDTLGKTSSDVEVIYFDKSFSRKTLKKSTFDSIKKKKDVEYGGSKKTSPERRYSDPALALIPDMISSVFSDKVDKKTGKVEKRYGSPTDKKQVDPWILNAIKKPFEKIGNMLGTNKTNEQKVNENVERIKKLL